MTGGADNKQSWDDLFGELPETPAAVPFMNPPEGFQDAPDHDTPENGAQDAQDAPETSAGIIDRKAERTRSQVTAGPATDAEQAPRKKKDKITPPKVDRRTATEKMIDAIKEKVQEQIKEEEKAPPKRPYHRHAPEEREAIYAAMRRKIVKETQTPIRFYLSTKKDAVLIEYIEKQENKSAFFRRLIIQDMQEKSLKAERQAAQKKQNPPKRS